MAKVKTENGGAERERAEEREMMQKGEEIRDHAREVLVGKNPDAVAVRQIFEGADLEHASPELKRRLEMDLMVNTTAEYRRINLTETFVALGCDPDLAVTHWRVAKIMDGLNYCSKDLGIVGQSMSADDVPSIYKKIRKGLINSRDIDVNVKDPNGKNVNCKASLVDFARFIDASKANREMGLYKISLEELTYQFFSNLGNPEAVILSRPVVEESGKKQINLLDESFNPIDDYHDLNFDEYFSRIKNSNTQAYLQLVGSWRWSSDDFRVMGGHASVVDVDGSLLWVPMSGRIAADITLTDLLKKENAGQKGQPQEVGEMDEKKTGAIIRFNIADLKQRNKGGAVRSIAMNPRLAKAMVGLTLGETPNASEQVEVHPENKDRKDIFLCGKELDNKIIHGIWAHYNSSVRKMRGRELTKEEAADIACTDVFFPCILNNENDWLTAIATSYGFNANTLINNGREKLFPGFTIQMTCLQLDSDGNPVEDASGNPIIKRQPFNTMKELTDYMWKRVKLGHIDQPTSGYKRDVAPGHAAPENKYSQDSIDDREGKVYKKIIRKILGVHADNYLTRFINDGNTALPQVINKKGELIGINGKFAGQTTLQFSDLIGEVLSNMPVNEMVDLLREIFPNMDEQDIYDDPTILVQRVVYTLSNLSDSDRKKLK